MDGFSGCKGSIEVGNRSYFAEAVASNVKRRGTNVKY
jgi:hypothetical protein